MIEEVWKREQQAEHEKRKLEEMKKENSRGEKVGGVATRRRGRGTFKEERTVGLDVQRFVSGRDEIRRYEIYSSRRRGRTGRVETRTRTTRGLAAGTTGTEGGISRVLNMDDPKQRVEQWNKMNNDPLLAMKQREMQARENIASNPVRREQIRREVDERKRRKKEKAREKKERKRAKKERKKEKYREKIRERERERRKGGRSSRRGRRGRDDYSGSSSSGSDDDDDDDDDDSSSTSSYSRERRRKKTQQRIFLEKKKEDIHLLHLRGREADHRHLVESQPSKEKRTINTACRTQTSARNRQLRREEIEDMNVIERKRKRTKSAESGTTKMGFEKK